MELKEGYKKTELGVIPEDWDVKEFVEVIDGFSSGQTPYRGKPEFYKGNIPWITSGELNYEIITDTKEKITKEGVADANLKTIPNGTFLFAITGLEAAGTRGSCAITGIEATTNQSCMALYPKKRLLTTPYLFHYYVRYGNELAFKYCQGTKQQSFTGGIAKRLPIIVPPTITEQTAIATALSDTDALITSIEKLIAKKRLIKQGAMQKLLSPKEGWEVKKLGEIANINMGQSPLSVYYNSDGVGLPLVQGNADIENRKTTIRFYTSMITKKGKTGNIIMSVRAPVGEISKATFDCCLGRGVCSISYDNEYLYHYLIYFEKSWAKLSTGSTFDSVNSKQVKELEVLMPPTKDEQIQIATILSDMDTEIEALETKLAKYKQIKQGMMQNLLTGKIRLVKPNSNELEENINMAAEPNVNYPNA